MSLLIQPLGTDTGCCEQRYCCRLVLLNRSSRQTAVASSPTAIELGHAIAHVIPYPVAILVGAPVAG